MRPARATVCKYGVGRVNRHKNTHSQTGIYYDRHAQHEGSSGAPVGGGSVGFVGLVGASGTKEVDKHGLRISCMWPEAELVNTRPSEIENTPL